MSNKKLNLEDKVFSFFRNAINLDQYISEKQITQKAIAEATNDISLIIQFDEKGKVVYANQNTLKLYSVIKDHIKKIHQTQVEKDNYNLSHFINIKKTIDREGDWVGELNIETDSGVSYPIYVSIIAAKTQTNKTKGYIAVGRILGEKEKGLFSENKITEMS